MWEFLTGLISGTVSGTGMGGGTILILVLSVFLGIEQHVAQATNLVFFVPTSISAIIVSIKSKLIEWKIGIILCNKWKCRRNYRCKHFYQNGSNTIKKIIWCISCMYCNL